MLHASWQHRRKYDGKRSRRGVQHAVYEQALTHCFVTATDCTWRTSQAGVAGSVRPVVETTTWGEVVTHRDFNKHSVKVCGLSHKSHTGPPPRQRFQHICRRWRSGFNPHQCLPARWSAEAGRCRVSTRARLSSASPVTCVSHKQVLKNSNM